MSILKRIVCLANSRKMSGRCIAGREWTANGAGRWIRPVSDAPTEELPPYLCRYGNGPEIGVLDILDVPLLEYRPHEYQQENWLIARKIRCVKRGVLPWSRLAGFVSMSRTLWINGVHTRTGSNDCVPLEIAAGLTNSLEFVHTMDLRLKVFAPGESFGNPKRRVQAWFTHAGFQYGVWVTDTVVEREYLALPNGEYPAGEAYLTVSLGEPYKGECFKLAAAIIRKGRLS